MYRYYMTYIEDDLIQTEEGIIEVITDLTDSLDEEEIEILSIDIRQIVEDPNL